MKLYLTIAIWGLAVMCGTALFWTSTQVQIAESHRAELQKEIEERSEHLTILLAEWHYLNNPAYLEELALSVINNNKALSDKEGPIILANAAALPDIAGTVLPVRRPDFDSAVIELAQITTPSPSEESNAKPLVTEAKPRHAVSSRPSESAGGFGVLLASWTQ